MKLVKVDHLLALVKDSLQSGEYVFTGHAAERLQQREVSRLEVKQALTSGFHEKKKDMYDDNYKCWNYSIRGKTVDNRDLRIIVSFDSDGMLIITVIDIKRRI